MADIAGEIDAKLAFQRFHEFAKGLEPVKPHRAQRAWVHVFDPGKNPLDEFPVLRPHRRCRKAAITAQNGGDAVEARHRRIGIIGDLRIVMGVGVDNPGCDDQPAGIDFFAGAGAFEPADLGNPAVANAEIDTPARQPRAIDDVAAAHDQIVVHSRNSQFVGA